MSKYLIITMIILLIFGVTTGILMEQKAEKTKTSCYDNLNNKIIGVECEQENLLYPMTTALFFLLTIIFFFVCLFYALDGDE